MNIEHSIEAAGTSFQSFYHPLPVRILRLFWILVEMGQQRRKEAHSMISRNRWFDIVEFGNFRYKH